MLNVSLIHFLVIINMHTLRVLLFASANSSKLAKLNNSLNYVVLLSSVHLKFYLDYLKFYLGVLPY